MSSDLLNRRHEQTRAEIARAAIELFSTRGFDNTTMEDVAAAAGVSRRTAYRHFANKDDLVFEQPRRWLVRFREVVADRAEQESARDLCRHGLLAVAELIHAERRAVLDAYAVLVATPSLAARRGKSDAEWFACCVELVGRDLASLPRGALQTATIAGTLVGAMNALVAVWAAQQPGSDLRTMTVEVLDQIDGIWPEQSR